jgi:hypothetical protein
MGLQWTGDKTVLWQELDFGMNNKHVVKLCYTRWIQIICPDDCRIDLPLLELAALLFCIFVTFWKPQGSYDGIIEIKIQYMRNCHMYLHSLLFSGFRLPVSCISKIYFRHSSSKT